MKKLLFFFLSLLPLSGFAQPVLPAPDFVRAVERSGGVCVVALGVIEKCGAQVPRCKHRHSNTLNTKSPIR